MSDKRRLPSYYNIGGPFNGQKFVDNGTGVELQTVKPGETFVHFYEYVEESSIYCYVQPNVVAAILKHGRQADPTLHGVCSVMVAR